MSLSIFLPIKIIEIGLYNRTGRTAPEWLRRDPTFKISTRDRY